MAKYKNVAGEPRELRFLNRVVEDGEVFEVRDDIAKNLVFSPEIFQEITPAKSKPAKKAAPPKPPAVVQPQETDGAPVVTQEKE